MLGAGAWGLGNVWQAGSAGCWDRGLMGYTVTGGTGVAERLAAGREQEFRNMGWVGWVRWVRSWITPHQWR